MSDFPRESEQRSSDNELDWLDEDDDLDYTPADDGLDEEDAMLDQEMEDEFHGDCPLHTPAVSSSNL